MSPAGGRVGVMVVRIWIDADGSFRARLTHTDDLSHREQASAVAGTADEVVAAVRVWVDRFVVDVSVTTE